MFGFPVEPNADLRNAAAGMFETYVSLVNAGFNEDQAMQLTRDMLREAMRNQAGGNADS